MLLNNFNCGFCNASGIATLMNGSTASYTNTELLKLSSLSENCHYCGGGNLAYHVMIGGGDTPVTKDDYDMADTSIIASDKMKSMKQIASYTLLSGASITTQWINNSSEPITIKELGLAYKYGNAAYEKNANILVSRKVLTTPLTVQPGETYAFTYNIKV